MGKGVQVFFTRRGALSIELHIIKKTGVNIPVIINEDRLTGSF
jgi:hypothetical protein